MDPVDEATALNLMFINDVINPASAICGLLVVIIITVLHRIDPKSTDRLSIRFTLAISVVDIIKALLIMAYNYDLGDGEDVLCKLVPFLTHWFILIYLSLNFTIALNLQLIFLNGISLSKKVEKYYWACSFLVPTLLMIIPLGLDKFGRDENAVFCYFKGHGSFETNLILWTTFLSWSIGSVLYCTVIVILVIINLEKKVTILDHILSNSDRKHRSLQKSKLEKLSIDAEEECTSYVTNLRLKTKIKKLIRRVSLYCIIPIITHLGYLVLRALSCYYDYTPKFLAYISVIGSDIPGILNLVGLLLDPALSVAIHSATENQKTTHIAGLPENERSSVGASDFEEMSETKSNGSEELDNSDHGAGERVDLTANGVGFFKPIRTPLNKDNGHNISNTTNSSSVQPSLGFINKLQPCDDGSLRANEVTRNDTLINNHNEDEINWLNIPENGRYSNSPCTATFNNISFKKGQLVTSRPKPDDTSNFGLRSKMTLSAFIKQI